jgi:acyl-CoA synthetase (AMP-forming)/AMP-acid ligase II
LETSQDVIFNPEDFQNKWLQDEEIGEVVVMGSHVLDSYYKSQDIFKKQKIKVEGNLWHKTGDSGYIKDDLLYLTGSCHSLIKKGDRLISPFIFENKVRQITGVNKGTIIENNGKLTVVLESSISAASLEPQLKKIINYDAVLILKSIPMDVRHLTKINYYELKTLLKRTVN